MNNPTFDGDVLVGSTANGELRGKDNTNNLSTHVTNRLVLNPTSNLNGQSNTTMNIATVNNSQSGDGMTLKHKPAPRPDKLFGIRHLQAILMFLGIFVSYSLRINLSVSVVAMVDKDSANPDYPEYAWDESTQSIVLSSFFWGYFLMQFPGGPIAERFGPHPLLVVSLFVGSVVSILTPVAADWGGYVLVCACRVVLGLSQGVMFPSFHNLLAHWTPARERGRLVTFTYSGAQFGTIISLPICGLLATSAAGWPSTFYVFGCLGIAWSALWFFLGSNSPAEDRFISQEEREYIQDSLETSSQSEVANTTPWMALMTSLPFWAVVAANCGHSWGFWTLMTEMPTFMKTVLGFDLKKNGFLSALPYLAMFILSFVFSWASDFVNKKKLVSLTASRKIFNSIAQWGGCAALLGLAYATDSTIAIVLLTVAVGVTAANYVGFNINHIDLAPNYAGTMVGLTNGAGNFMSFIGPLTVGAIVKESGSVSQWRIVFFIAAGLYFLSNLIFVLCGTAKLQAWNDPVNTKSNNMEKAIATIPTTDSYQNSVTNQNVSNLDPSLIHCNGSTPKQSM